MTQHENIEHKFFLSSSQKPSKIALQPIKACKTFQHFQLGENWFDFIKKQQRIENIFLCSMYTLYDKIRHMNALARIRQNEKKKQFRYSTCSSSKMTLVEAINSDDSPNTLSRISHSTKASN